ncbi:MAG TPA: tryptophan synthase subunit alpha [Methanoregulaceae archaeon]|nr:tryptophan synthase subunit alpha [Methanoregulaceae archaeon]
MSRLACAFSDPRRPALVAFTVAGDPDPATSARIAATLLASGADVLELGMPYSDPTGDGSVIERADARALAAGMTPAKLFALVRTLRDGGADAPIVLLCYFNVLYRYGVDRFCREAAAAGVDGLLCVDLPVEQSDELLPACRVAGLDRVLMASPSTGDPRLARIGREAEGFVYAVSTRGVTGVRDGTPVAVGPFVERLRGVTDLPIAVGFGIATPDQACAVVAAGADGAIVGSAIVSLVEVHRSDEPALHRALGAYVLSLRAALDRSPG